MNEYRKMDQIVLTKGQEKYIFRYGQGHEYELLDALVASAKDQRTSFDWFDAAVISFKLTQYLINEADMLLNENNVDPTNQTFNPGDSYNT